MNELKLSVYENTLTPLNSPLTTSGSTHYDKCTFTFEGESWNTLTRIAVFSIGSDDNYSIVLKNDNSCYIPSPCLEKIGIIRIGVCGVNDSGTVITTNIVVHRVTQGIESGEIWTDEDNSLLSKAISDATAIISDYKTNIKDIINSSATLLQQIKDTYAAAKLESPNEELISTVIPEGSWYKPSEIKNFETAPQYSSTLQYENMLDYIMNTLVADYGNYVTKRNLGIDSSGALNIYAYTLAPANYEKTVLVCANSHQYGYSPFMGLSCFFKKLCSEYSLDNNLNYIRQKVKIVFVPCICPYCFENGKDYNYNNVRLTRNFPYNWENSISTYKGSTAGDQAETKILMSLLDELTDDKLCSVIEVEGSIASSSKSLYYPRYVSNCLAALKSMLNTMNSEYEQSSDYNNAYFEASNVPSLINYAAYQHDLNSCMITWGVNGYTDGESGVAGIYKMCEMFGNTLLTMAKNSRIPQTTVLAPFIKHIFWKSQGSQDVFTIPTDTTSDTMGISKYMLSLNGPYNVTLNGNIKINVTSACTIKILPVLYQVSSPDKQDFSLRCANSEFEKQITLSPGMHYIPLLSVLKAYFSNVSETHLCSGKVGFLIKASADIENAATVTAFEATFSFMPSDIGKSLEISTPMGLVEDYSTAKTLPTQTIKYPVVFEQEYIEFSYID